MTNTSKNVRGSHRFVSLVLQALPATCFSLVGVVLTWLVYPVAGRCELIYPGNCGDNPRLAPAISFSVLIVVVWGLLLAAILSPVPRRKRFVIVGASVALGVIMLVAPLATLWAGGFSIPQI